MYWVEFLDFDGKVKYQDRYIRSKKVTHFWNVSKKHLLLGHEIYLPIKFYKSQIGFVEDVDELEGHYALLGLPRDRMKAMSDQAFEGRANPKGIPYLYLSSQEQTSMAELRLHVGQYISCTQF